MLRAGGQIVIGVCAGGPGPAAAAGAPGQRLAAPCSLQPEHACVPAILQLDLVDLAALGGVALAGGGGGGGGGAVGGLRQLARAVEVVGSGGDRQQGGQEQEHPGPRHGGGQRDGAEGVAQTSSEPAVCLWWAAVSN